MPTNKPRITITLEPEMHDTLRRLAKVQGRTISAVIREYLDAVEAPLERVASVLEALQRQKEKVEGEAKGVSERIAEDATQAERGATEMLEHLMAQMDMFVQSIEEEGGERRAEQSVSADASPRPPATNRGVRSVPYGEAVKYVLRALWAKYGPEVTETVEEFALQGVADAREGQPVPNDWLRGLPEEHMEAYCIGYDCVLDLASKGGQQ